jgi:hypothetical protein
MVFASEIESSNQVKMMNHIYNRVTLDFSPGTKLSPEFHLKSIQQLRQMSEYV